MSPKKGVVIMNIILKKGEEVVLEKKNIPYEKKENSIVFPLEDMVHTLNLETKEFIRENEEYAFFLDIENKNCEITLKKEKYYLQVQVEYANLLENKNEINLTYFIETDDSATELILELEGE